MTPHKKKFRVSTNTLINAYADFLSARQIPDSKYPDHIELEGEEVEKTDGHERSTHSKDCCIYPNGLGVCGCRCHVHAPPTGEGEKCDCEKLGWRNGYHSDYCTRPVPPPPQKGCCETCYVVKFIRGENRHWCKNKHCPCHKREEKVEVIEYASGRITANGLEVRPPQVEELPEEIDELYAPVAGLLDPQVQIDGRNKIRELTRAVNKLSRYLRSKEL